MDRLQTIEILSILKAAYPHSYQNLTKRDVEAIIKLWMVQFESNPAEEVAAAVQALISTREVGYSITPGEVKEQIRKLHAVDELDEISAWALVSKACQNGVYGYKKEFAKLPPEVQRAVGAPEQLREWGLMDSETVQSVVASNFMRNYRTTQARAKELEKLPQSVREQITGVAERLKLK